MEKNNKKIAINTIIIYVRMIITTIVGIFTTRIVLKALGVSDYGLYNVVGGIIVMLNIVSVAMSTTTTRYINREQGEENGNVNKIFNICLQLHIFSGLFLLLIAETVGMLYIYNMLNVSPGKIDDALFVFQVSTITALIGVINVPYQSLVQSYERFDQVAYIDIISALLKLSFVFLLTSWSGNPLRFYVIGMSVITLLSFIGYTSLCYYQWNNVVNIHFYNDWKKIKEIFVFNNYVVIGASSYLGRTQGSTMIVNYFFNTAINGSMAIAYQVENYLISFVTNIGRAASPQIFQSYATNIEHSVLLTARVTKYSSLLMLLIVFPVFVAIEWLLHLWLGEIPDGAVLFCQLTLISALLRSLSEGLPTLIQANGNIKIFQLTGSVLELVGMPIAILAFYFGAPAFTIMVIYAFFTFSYLWVRLPMIKYFLKIDITPFLRNVYYPLAKAIICCIVFYILGLSFPQLYFHLKLVFALEAFIVVVVSVYFTCLDSQDKNIINNKIKKYL